MIDSNSPFYFRASPPSPQPTTSAPSSCDSRTFAGTQLANTHVCAFATGCSNCLSLLRLPIPPRALAVALSMQQSGGDYIANYKTFMVKIGIFLLHEYFSETLNKARALPSAFLLCKTYHLPGCYWRLIYPSHLLMRTSNEGQSGNFIMR